MGDEEPNGRDRGGAGRESFQVMGWHGQHCRGQSVVERGAEGRLGGRREPEPHPAALAPSSVNAALELSSHCSQLWSLHWIRRLSVSSQCPLHLLSPSAQVD